MSDSTLRATSEKIYTTVFQKISGGVPMKKIESDTNWTGKVFCTSFDSLIGHIYIASTEKGLCKVNIPKETKKDFFHWLENHFEMDAIVENKSRNKEYIDQITRYLKGKLVQFNFPVDLIGTPFQVRVWRELAKIPYGVTLTYKQLAKRVGVPKGFQAIGKASSSNPLPIVIPCHRVIGSDGSLIGYASGVKTKEFLLRLEGVLLV